MGITAADRARTSVGGWGLGFCFSLFHASGWPVFSAASCGSRASNLCSPPLRTARVVPVWVWPRRQANGGPSRPPVAAVRRRLRRPLPTSRLHTGTASPPHRIRPPTARSHLPFVRGAGQRAAPSEGPRFHDPPPPPQRELPCHTVIWCCRGRSRPFTSDARSGCQSRGRIPAPGRRRTTQRQALAGRYTSLHASGSMVGRPAPSIAHAAERGGNSQRGGWQASRPIRVALWAGAGSTRRVTARRRPSLAQPRAAGVSATGRRSFAGSL